ncbi:hypothetical protein BST45_04665 [Mycobacterium shinjukuense]|uniref:Uncharacterized protein n=1 Tax=Mycobacterium shinjukuense TaxID=398694 RepID=A0A7I7MMW7_9MYCO|nr:hypothetical protein BST45_04665 [Mycobacterium shinjukuense]BBX73127.1 hypothetical protein MSHI_10330 [Mycobacterium shinjukuense]
MPAAVLWIPGQRTGPLLFDAVATLDMSPLRAARRPHWPVGRRQPAAVRAQAPRLAETIAEALW